MKWTSSFETREASSKREFGERLRGMDRQRWAENEFRYLYYEGRDITWGRRVWGFDISIHQLIRK